MFSRMLQLILLLTILIVSALSQQINPPNCGFRPKIESHIVGGTIARSGSWPWLVSFRYGGSHFCGGSLINDRWVLTAAHCVDGRSTPNFYFNYSFQIGVDNRNQPNPWTHIRNVDFIIKHQAYNKITFENDIALVRLKDPAIIDDDYVLPVCIPTSEKKLDDEIAWAAGWGTLSSGATTLPEDAYEVPLPITSDADCFGYYGKEYKPASMICAGKVGGDKDSCQGDSGGPLSHKNPITLKWEEVGVVSWGYGCGDIGVYARVSPYANWIVQTMLQNP